MKKAKQKYSAGIKKWMFGYLFVLGITEVLALVFPMLLQGVTQIIGEGAESEYYDTGDIIRAVLVRAALVFGFIVLIMVVSVVAEFLLSNYANRYSRNMRRKLFNKLQRVSTEDLENFGSSKIVPTVLNDTLWMRLFTRRVLQAIIFIPVTIFGSIFMMFQLSTIYALIALSAVPVIALFYWWNLKKMSKLIPDTVTAFDDYFTNIKEGIIGARDIRILGKANERAKEFNKLVKIHRQQGEQTDKRNNFAGAFASVLFTIITIFLILYGIHFGMSDVEDLIILNTVLLYLARVQTGVHNTFVWFVEAIPRARVTKKRLDAVYELPEMPNEGGLINVPRFHEPWIEFSGIDYEYPNGKRAIRNFNVRVSYDTRVAIAGGVGSGKSVLGKLITRDAVPTGGEILLNGLDISSINRRYLRRELISYIGGSPMFENATVRDNMKRLAPEATDEEILKVFSCLGADDFVSKFGDNFLDYVINDKSRLSEGSKNLFNIVRGYLKPASIYVFNQCFEHVDTAYLANLMEMLKNDKKTCLFFSYDTAIANSCDTVHVLKNGKIVEAGKHSQLVKQSDEYKKFYAAGLGTIAVEEGEIAVLENTAEDDLGDDDSNMVREEGGSDISAIQAISSEGV